MSRDLDALLAAFDDESWRARKDAVAAAARWPHAEELLPRLVALLGADASVAARGAALETLAAVGEPAVPLLTALVDGRAPERKFAIDALAEVGSPAAVPSLIAALDDEDDNVRAAAAEALAEIAETGGDREAAIAALRRQIGVGELLPRLAALAALSRLAARLALAEVLPLVEEPVLRPVALVAAGRSGDLEALPHLLAALAEPGRGPRAAAMLGLTLLHDAQAEAAGAARVRASVRASPPAAVAGVVTALAEGATAARRAAATLAGWGRWPAALPGLAAALLDDALHDAAADAIAAYGAYAVAPLVALAHGAPASQRREVLLVLPRLGGAAADRRVAELCERALGDDGGAAASAAAQALGEIGGKDDLATLLRVLERASAVDEETLAAAGAALARLAGRFPDEARMLIGARPLEGAAGAALCRVLGAVGHPGDRPRVLAALRDGDPSLRAAAAAALASLGAADETAEALVFALADEDAAVRAAAAAALGSLGARDAVAALAGAGHDDDATVAAAAARALGSVGGREALAVLRDLLARRGDGAAAVAAVEGIAAAGDAADDARLVAAARSDDPEVAKAAVRGLAGRRGADARRALVEALQHERWDVRCAAAHALAGAGVEGEAALRVRAAVERDPLVREALAAALATRP